jgi:hypothetical protein
MIFLKTITAQTAMPERKDEVSLDRVMIEKKLVEFMPGDITRIQMDLEYGSILKILFIVLLQSKIRHHVGYPPIFLRISRFYFSKSDQTEKLIYSSREGGL